MQQFSNPPFLHFFFLFFPSFLCTFTSSSPPSNFTVYGTATVNRTSITLTQNLQTCSANPPYSNVGRVFYKHPLRFLDSSFNSTLSFSTRFSFIIIPPPPHCLSGEGIAFFITSDSNYLPRTLGSIGLPDQNSIDSSSFLAVEFDTSYDQNLGDINDNHVGIDLDSVYSLASVDLMTNGIDLMSGKKLHVWIMYRNSEKVIQIWVGYSKIKPDSPILVAPINLSKRFNGFMYVGFSASNGIGSVVHLIDYWQFKTFESKSRNIEVEEVGSKNCLICFPEDPGKEERKTRLPNNHHTDKRVLELALGLLGLNVVLILLIVSSVMLYMWLTKRRNHRTEQARIVITFRENRIPKRLKLSDIRSATNGFNRNQIIGEGASTIVYEGNLGFSSGTVAVKRFKTGSFGNQFISEFATTVGLLRHKNLVALHGWCCERNVLFLVYDYMPNGSLDKLLHHQTDRLSFETRLNILLGVSSALIYLHDECKKPIIHRNVKTRNIMLDFDFVPKLGDFGMVERTLDSTLPAGTMGYLAPEYVYSGVPTIKTDIYSFGVVVLEVASGRPPVDENGMAVADWVWDLWEEKRLVDAADPNLMGRFDNLAMEMILMVGLICVHPNYQMRPTMKEVMLMLQGGLVPELPATKPTVMVMSERSPEEVVRSGGDGDGEDSVTAWATPKSHFS